jgi:ribosomal protein S18 acetylase RimI-like enzyme
MKSAWEVREAGLDDLSAILVLAAACNGAPAWSEAMWTQVLRDGARVTFVAEQDGVMLGLVVANYIVVDSEIESIAVRSEARGLGSVRWRGLASKVRRTCSWRSGPRMQRLCGFTRRWRSWSRAGAGRITVNRWRMPS